MSDPLSIYDQAVSQGPSRGAPAPSTWQDTIAASYRVARDEQVFEQDARLQRRYQEIVVGFMEKAKADGREVRFRDFMDRRPGVGMAVRPELVWQEIGRQRAADPTAFADLGDRATFEQRILRRDGGRDRDQRTIAGGGLLPMVLGSIGGEAIDPINVASMAIPGGVGGSVAKRIFTAGLASAAVEGAMLPGRFEAVEKLGEEMSWSDAASALVFAFAGGAALQGLGEGAAAGARRLNQRLNPIERQLARALEQAEPQADPRAIAAEVIAANDPELAADILSGSRGGLTLEESGALSALRREAEIDASNPFAPIGTGRAEFEDGISRAIDDVLMGTQASRVASDPAPRQPAVDDFDMPAYLQRNAAAESGFDDLAQAQTSSAFGRYQFLRDTWLDFYKRTFGETGESKAAILRKRADGDVQDQVMETFTRTNLDRLSGAGFEVTQGNAYLAHFLGVGDALRVLRASPETPIGDVVNARSIGANQAVFDDITSTSELVAWAHEKMGGGGASVLAGGGPVAARGAVNQGAVLRDEAAELSREATDIDGLGPVEFERFDPEAIDVDADLMQFKAGGDQFGVTERLQGVERWNPLLAGRVAVWEALDGRRLIADGHQRLGLARRIKSLGDGQSPSIDAFVLREIDGWDAETVRTWAALKNIAEGSGSTVDAAKVLRGLPRETWGQYLPPRSALVRDAEGLTRLGDDAFGMVVNELIDPAHAAIVGRIARDPSEQKALADLLLRLAPRTRGEADAVIRQGMASGFSRQSQEDMFGVLESASSLYIERARVLDRGLAELRKMRQAFGSAARNADALESAGNRINREASAKEIEDNAKAIELVQRSAWTKGPVKDAIDAGAARLAAGERLGPITADFVARIRELDLDDLARLAGSGEGARGRGGYDGSRRASEVGQADAALQPIDGDPAEPRLTREGDPIDPVDGAWPARDAIEDGPNQPIEGDIGQAAGLFDAPDGQGARAQTGSLEHDARLALSDDAAIDVAAGSPDTQALRALVEDLGEDPTFTIDGEERTIGAVLDEADSVRRAIAAAKACL